jgi:hypothetical protein
MGTPIQRQLADINCTPDEGVVSCLFGSDSHTTFEIQHVIDRLRGQNRRDTYVSIGLFTDEFELKRGIRWEVHRRPPHGITNSIQWYLHPSSSAISPNTTTTSIPRCLCSSCQAAARCPLRRCSSEQIIRRPCDPRAIGYSPGRT